MRDARYREMSHGIHAARYLESSLKERTNFFPSGAEINTTNNTVKNEKFLAVETLHTGEKLACV